MDIVTATAVVVAMALQVLGTVSVCVRVVLGAVYGFPQWQRGQRRRQDGSDSAVKGSVKTAVVTESVVYDRVRCGMDRQMDCTRGGWVMDGMDGTVKVRKMRSGLLLRGDCT